MFTEACQNCPSENVNLQLQETGVDGAVGKDHLVFRNSGEVKRDLMGSLAGPESPNPWSQRTKLRAAIDAGLGEDWFDGRVSSMNKTVLLTVTINRTIGFAITISFMLDHRPRTSFRAFANLGEFDVKWLKLPLNMYWFTLCPFMFSTCSFLTTIVSLEPEDPRWSSWWEF